MTSIGGGGVVTGISLTAAGTGYYSQISPNPATTTNITGTGTGLTINVNAAVNADIGGLNNHFINADFSAPTIFIAKHAGAYGIQFSGGWVNGQAYISSNAGLTEFHNVATGGYGFNTFLDASTSTVLDGITQVNPGIPTSAMPQVQRCAPINTSFGVSGYNGPTCMVSGFFQAYTSTVVPIVTASQFQQSKAWAAIFIGDFFVSGQTGALPGIAPVKILTDANNTVVVDPTTGYTLTYYVNTSGQFVETTNAPMSAGFSGTIYFVPYEASAGSGPTHLIDTPNTFGTQFWGGSWQSTELAPTTYGNPTFAHMGLTTEGVGGHGSCLVSRVWSGGGYNNWSTAICPDSVGGVTSQLDLLTSPASVYGGETWTGGPIPSVTAAAASTVGYAVCVKSTPPTVLGVCSTQPNSSGACTCN